MFDHDQPAGLGTDTLPAAPAQYLPLTGTRRTLGVLAVRPNQRRRLLLPEQRHLLETFAGQIALAVERAQLAEEAEIARVAVETESLRNTLLASISHDLRTPLAVITGASSALNDPSLNLDAQARAQLAQSIDAKAHEMSDLISNVLDLMRFEAGEVRLQRDWQTVDDLVGTALTRLEGRFGDRPIDVDLPAELPPVHVDAPLVTQVFGNLLENAIKHTPPGTRIRISAALEDDAVRVCVDDTGPGLPAGRSGPAVCEVSAWPRREQCGRRWFGACDLQGCHQCARGKNRRDAAPGRRRALCVHSTHDGANRVTQAMFLILIVEDDPGICAVLRMLLESQQYRVVEAETAARGTIEARNHRPDLVVVDLGLPDRDGLSMIRDIRGFSAMPILVLSARTMETDKIAALDAGADDYVAKPFSAPEFLARVRAALRRNARRGDQLPLLRLGEVMVDLTKRSAKVQTATCI